MNYDPKTAFGNEELIHQLKRTKGARRIGNICPTCNGDAATRDENEKITGPCLTCKGRGIMSK